jgi:hypothetical protein
VADVGGRRTGSDDTKGASNPHRVAFAFRCKECGNELYDGVCGSHEHLGVQVDYTPKEDDDAG